MLPKRPKIVVPSPPQSFYNHIVLAAETFQPLESLNAFLEMGQHRRQRVSFTYKGQRPKGPVGKAYDRTFGATGYKGFVTVEESNDVYLVAGLFSYYNASEVTPALVALRDVFDCRNLGTFGCYYNDFFDFVHPTTEYEYDIQHTAHIGKSISSIFTGGITP